MAKQADVRPDRAWLRGAAASDRMARWMRTSSSPMPLTRYLFLISNSPTPAFTPQPIPVGSSLKAIGEAALADAEQHAIRRALEAARGNKSEAARHLRTDYRTLHRKMKQYGIGPGRFRVFEHC